MAQKNLLFLGWWCLDLACAMALGESTPKLIPPKDEGLHHIKVMNNMDR
jgi:hypothetical protein